MRIEWAAAVVLLAVSGDFSAMGALDGLPLGTLTPAGLLAVVVLLIAVGRLVPRRTMEDVIHDRNEWRAAHRVSEQARQELAEQVGELLEHARTTNKVLSSLPRVEDR